MVYRLAAIPTCMAQITHNGTNTQSVGPLYFWFTIHAPKSQGKHAPLLECLADVLKRMPPLLTHILCDCSA